MTGSFVALASYVHAQTVSPGDAQSSERLIAGFDDDVAPLRGWRVTNGDVQLEPSSELATQGERSLRITYGTDGWRIPRLDLESRGATSWEGWDTFEFDVYNSEAEAVSLRVVVYGGGVSSLHSHNVRIPPGQWYRYRMSARHFAGHGAGTVDRNAITGFTVMGHPNYLQHGKPITIFLDNIRLTNQSQRRLAEVQGLSTRLTGETRLTLTNPFGSRAADEPAPASSMPSAVPIDFASELARLQEAVDGSPEPRAADSISVRILEIEQALAETARKSLVRHLARTPEVAPSVPVVREPGVPAELVPLEESTGNTIQRAYDREVAALADAEEALRELLGEARLKADIERMYSGSPFAVGIPSVPTAWADRTYSGAVGRDVRLRAARHEYEPFQLVVLPRGSRLEDVRVTASPLVGAAGEIAADHVEIAPMGWRHGVDGPALADMIRTDIESFSVEPDSHQPLWGNVYVPEGTPPGEYSGTITVQAAGLQPVTVGLHLTVWPFTLPHFSTLETATWDSQGISAMQSGRHEEHARMVIEHRWNANYLYLWGDAAPLPLETMQRLTELGSTLHNLIRISRNFLRFEAGPDGQLRTTADRRDWFFRRLDPIIAQIEEEDPSFLQHLMLYGFDEPSADELPAMNELYGQLKERYGREITTAFATMHDYWETHPDLENLDVWAVLLSRLTPEVVEDLQSKGHRVWWYNIYAGQEDPVRTRVQFWGTFKDGIDGVLHYNLREAGDGTSPTALWGPALWPAETRTDGGVKRMTTDEGPISTVAFNYWREGMEDVEYLVLLRDAADALRARMEAEAPHGQPSHEVRALLREADDMVSVPEHITLGVLGGGTREVGEVIMELGGHTDDMSVLMDARHRIADMIARIQSELGR